MKCQLEAKLQEVRARRNFDVKKWIAEKCEMLNEYMRRSHLKGCVVNVSGGIDSAVITMLAKHAQTLPNSPITRIVGILQPIHSTESIWRRGELVTKAAGVEQIIVDQTSVFDMLAPLVEQPLGLNGEDKACVFGRGQLKSYMRTPVAYYTCQLLSSSGCPSIVLGTGNYDEDGYLYYFCKPGDGTSDVQLIHDLHKSEVRKVARELNVPAAIIEAPPSADLWAGQTDENELGFSYDFTELFVELFYSPEERDKWIQTLDAENKAQWDDWAQKCETIHRRNSHKAAWPINIDICCPTGNQYHFK